VDSSGQSDNDEPDQEPAISDVLKKDPIVSKYSNYEASSKTEENSRTGCCCHLISSRLLKYNLYLSMQLKISSYLCDLIWVLLSYHVRRQGYLMLHISTETPVAVIQRECFNGGILTSCKLLLLCTRRKIVTAKLEV
jgi:hypothetical protein